MSRRRKMSRKLAKRLRKSQMPRRRKKVYEGRKEVWKLRDVKGEERRIGS